MIEAVESKQPSVDPLDRGVSERVDPKGDAGEAEADSSLHPVVEAYEDDRRARTVDGLRHIDEQISFYNSVLAYVREQGHGNAEGVVLRIVRDLETLRAIPLPLSDEEAAAQESDDPIVQLQRDNADLRRRLGQLETVSPHGFVNTTRTLRPAHLVDNAPLAAVNVGVAQSQTTPLDGRDLKDRF